MSIHPRHRYRLSGSRTTKKILLRQNGSPPFPFSFTVLQFSVNQTYFGLLQQGFKMARMNRDLRMRPGFMLWFVLFQPGLRLNFWEANL